MNTRLCSFVHRAVRPARSSSMFCGDCRTRPCPMNPVLAGHSMLFYCSLFIIITPYLIFLAKTLTNTILFAFSCAAIPSCTAASCLLSYQRRKTNKNCNNALTSAANHPENMSDQSPAQNFAHWDCNCLRPRHPWGLQTCLIDGKYLYVSGMAP